MARIRGLGQEVRLVREPGGTGLGEKIRSLLQHDKAGEGMCPEAELLLFSASRAQLVREVILPELRMGVTVLADRFFDSTTVYQGVGRGLQSEDIAAAIRLATGGLKPDATILLDIAPEVGMARLDAAGREKDRMERAGAAFFQKVREGYLKLAEAEPDRVFCLDGTRNPDDTEREIWKIIEEKQHGLFD